MIQRRVGVAVEGPSSTAVLAGIETAEEMGIQAAWLTTGGAGRDGLTLFAAAAARTETIMLGTSITPIFPRHPVVVVQQVQVIAELAPGRFRLGVGPSHRPTMQRTFGTNFHHPLGHLSEYLRILKALLHEGSVEFDGRYYKAHASISSPVDVAVMASALQPKSFELCGAEADGAISWVCPGEYLRDVAVPALRAGAEWARRPVPPLIAHVPVCVHDSVEEVRAAVRRQFPNPRLPFYQRMFAAAGFPEAAEGSWSDSMINSTAVWGDESQVAERLQELLSFGATELLVSPVPAGNDRSASLERTLRLIGRVAGTLKA